MSKRNRQAGHTWERQIVKDLKNIFPEEEIYTSREMSRILDNQGIDIFTSMEIPKIQAKSTSKKGVPIHEWIDSMETDSSRTLLIKQTEKKGSRFYSQGEYAVIPYKLYLYFLCLIYGKDKNKCLT